VRKDEAAPRARWVEWPALLNARDLGGLPAAAGATRFGAVVRSDSLASLTQGGLAAMHDYGVGTVIDLRSPGERARWPSPVQGWSGYRARPVFDDAALRFVEERFSEDPGGFYVWPLARRPEAIAAILQTVARAAPGGVVIHCGIGKDRTGIVAALLLGLAGVDRGAVLSDFTLGADRLSRLADEDPDPDRRAQLRRWYRPDPALMIEMLDWLDRRFGGVAGYLRAAGLDEATQAGLRHRLTGG
jgi:protein-tyrosine phosphatase